LVNKIVLFSGYFSPNYFLMDYLQAVECDA